MGLWLPSRVMQGAILLCLAAATLVLWLTLNQPWLGLTLAPDAESDTVRIAGVHSSGPARALASPVTLSALGAAEGGPVIALEAGDLVEEPDTFESYEQIQRFMQRQSELAAQLREPRIALHLDQADTRSIATVTPSRRPGGDLPLSFWVQIVTGAGSLLIGAWVVAMRPADIVTRLFALSGAMILVSAYPAAIYSSRELAIDGGLFRILSAFNHVGALGFGMAMIAMFLCYPRRLVPLWSLWIIPAIFGPWLVADILRLLPSQTIGLQLPTLIEMLLIVGIVGLQWFVNRGDPRARAALSWLGLSVIVGAGAFVSLITAPILFDSVPPMHQGYAFGFFLLIYAGLALGVGRYRLFDLSEWAFRILFYTGGTLLLLAIDAALIAVLHMQQATSLGIALLAVGFIYLPLRGKLWDRFVARKSLEEHELFHAVIDVSFAASAPERSQRWRELLGRLFDPLAIEPADRGADTAQIRAEGLEMLLPAAADTPALILRYPWRGQRLFGTAHQKLARELVRLMRHAEDGRSAYERGGVEERGRIARDLHDDVGARLLSGLYKTELADTQRVLRDAIADMRTIVTGLSTHQPLLGQMIAALRHETGERLAAAGLELSWPIGKLDDEQHRLDYPTFRSLTSAHREVVSNIIRHAGARNVDIRIDEADGRLEMIIADDGIGIDPASASGRAQGNGIPGLMRRIGDIEGMVSLKPQAKGTLVRISLPLRTKVVAQAEKDVGAEPCGSALPHI
jgi:signal transduction histidine kinase